MKKMLFICLALTLIAVPSLWADDGQTAPQGRSPGYGYGGGMGPGMMGSGWGYHGMGAGMMGPGWGYRGMAPDYQDFQNMTPDEQRKWKEIRTKYMQDVLPLRQELANKQMELQTLWQMDNPDSDKMRELTKRISELRAKLMEKNDEYLMECRQEIGDLGWSCPGGSW